jgi:hypothetical protein
MLIGFLLLVAVLVGVAYFVKKNPKYSPEQEAQELIAKAGAEAKQIEDEVEAEAAKAAADIKTPLVNVEKEVQKL